MLSRNKQNHPARWQGILVAAEQHKPSRLPVAEEASVAVAAAVESDASVACS